MVNLSNYGLKFINGKMCPFLEESLGYCILVLCVERSKIVVSRTAEKHGVLVLDL